jgi:hypothetical protein
MEYALLMLLEKAEKLVNQQLQLLSSFLNINMKYLIEELYYVEK